MPGHNNSVDVRGARAGTRGSALLLASAALCIPVGHDRAEAQSTPDQSQQEIIVQGQSLFTDVIPERDLDEQSIAGYGASTVDELLSELQQELGEEELPLIIVNGERINDLDQIGALPVEVLRNVRVLPRGSAVRAGGRTGQRVISLTVKPTVKSATVLVAPKIATDGDWNALRGEAIGTYVRGATRANLTLRGRRESNLLESERDILQPDPRLPYALDGNVIGFPDTDGEIDPLLSALAGELVTVTPIPAIADPALSDFVANANDPAVTDIGEFRTLKPRVRNFDLNGTYAMRLASWLTGTATIRLGRNHSRSLRGLAQGLFVLSEDNPASPFSTDVGLSFYGPEPLVYRSRRDNGELNITLNGRFGKWTSNFNARHIESKDISRNERTAVFGPIALDNDFDPFVSDVSALITKRTDVFEGRSIADHAILSATGPAMTLPAGDVQATVEGRLIWARQRSESSLSPDGERRYRRTEKAVRGAVDVPLTSVANGFMPQFGDLNLTGEYSLVHFSDAGTLHNHSLGVNWEPTDRLRFSAETETVERAASVQLLNNPTTITPNVRVFDPLTGETVDVTQITGGIRTLDPESTRTRRVSGQFVLVPRLNLQLNAEYTDTDQRDFLSSLPEASAAVMLAFPDRFLRDSNGRLITVDLRPVNFDSHREKRLRYGFSLSTALGAGPSVAAISSSVGGDDGDDGVAAAPARTSSITGRAGARLQISANHSIVFSDEIKIRPGLDPVNLLEGGAIGIGGGRVRHQFDATASLNSRGVGARLTANWRGASWLDTRISGVEQRLRFSPLLLVNFRAFADASRLFGESAWTRQLRLSIIGTNLTNHRQRVRDDLGLTPLQYQRGYRDPIGRTIELEIRKVF